MRHLLAAALLFSLVACSSSDDKKTEAKKDDKPAGPALKVGDPAPAFKAAKWLNGPPVAVEPGKVYVLDFWATWCGPCIEAMPHLAELQREHKAEGLVVVPVTTADGRNPMKRIEEFVAKRGPKLGVAFAVCETRETDAAFMQAAEQGGIPCSFVIDKQGKIAFIGHPMELDDVLPQVLAGTWKGAEDLAAVEKVRTEFGALMGNADDRPEEALKAFAAFEAKYPAKAKQPMAQVSKIYVLVRAKKFDEAKTATEAAMKGFADKGQTLFLNKLRQIWADPELNPDKTHIGLSVAAAEAVVKIEGDTDPFALVGLADSYFVAGNKAKAVELSEKALKLADDVQLKSMVEQQLKKYKGK